VAASADGWNTFLMPVDAYRHKLDVLAEHCRDVGRDPADIRKQLVVQMLVRESDHDVRSASSEAVRRPGISGTPEQSAERLLDYVRLGVGDFLVGARAPADYETLELVAKRVAPIVKAEAKDLLRSRSGRGL
jgi:alkanesulfonate monooxygenase SsuD/methylene tetrahydromethanopterin reductase-like flavin-dependent oxidoreductase (luciferase family)